MEGYGDAGEYLERYLGEAYKAELLELVSDAAKTGIPVIGSINCAGAGDAWIEYAAAMQQAGASALELNIFLLPTDRRASAQEIESHYAGIVRKVVAEVTIPVSVKLPMRLTNVLSVGDALLGRGATSCAARRCAPMRSRSWTSPFRPASTTGPPRSSRCFAERRRCRSARRSTNTATR